MKIKFIFPKGQSRNFWDLKFSAKLSGKKYSGIPLSLPTLAGLTPKDIEVEIIDENIEPIDFNDKVDLVGISFFTAFANRAYEIADEFKKKGVKKEFKDLPELPKIPKLPELPEESEFETTLPKIPNVDLVCADLTKWEDVVKVVKDKDIIIQMAAVTSGAKDIAERPYIHVAPNNVMNSWLLQAAYDFNVKHFIFPSCTVMYQPNEIPVKETDFDASKEILPNYFGAGKSGYFGEARGKFEWNGKKMGREDYYRALLTVGDPREREEMTVAYDAVTISAMSKEEVGLFSAIDKLNEMAARYGYKNYAEMVVKIYNFASVESFVKMMDDVYARRGAELEQFVKELEGLNGGLMVNEWDVPYLTEGMIRRETGLAELPRISVTDAM